MGRNKSKKSKKKEQQSDKNNNVLVDDNQEVVQQIEKKTAELESALEEQKNKYLRLYAEFENYKKRAVREKIDLISSAAKDTLSALLPVVDDFDRAIKNAPDGQLPEGIQLIYNKFVHILNQRGLKEMESTNQPFDPEFHEAITEIPAPSEDLKGKVIDTVEKGYFLNDKIIRHAKVVVGK